MAETDEITALKAEMAALRASARRAEDYIAVCNLQAIYGYYVDKALWDEAADLFARDATLEIAARGLFRGQERIRGFLHRLPALKGGLLFNHMQLQPVVHVAEDGESAEGRWRAIMEVAIPEGSMVGEATYENRYVREDGVWKIARLHAFITHYRRVGEGWETGAVPMRTVMSDYPPDAPQTIAYQSFPEVFVPPFHYPNPVTGRRIAGEASEA